MPSSSQPSQPRNLGSIIKQTIGVDCFLLFIAVLMGFLFSGAVSVVNDTNNLGTLMLRPPQWLIFMSCVIGPLLYLLVDILSSLTNPLKLPFARSMVGTKSLYAKRIHLLLLALYFTAILVALCWSALSMPLFSKLFVSAVFAVALYALGQSIPSRRMSFIVSGCLFLVVLVATQAFIVMRLRADSAKANQQVLDELVAPPEEATEQKPSNFRDDGP
jgi:hypothetical protein